MDLDQTLGLRARRHAALGDPTRLAIADELTVSDRSPVELRRHLDLESNLLAHHLDVLEQVGLVERSRSSGDGRRRYVHLRLDALDGLSPGRRVVPGPALFVCRGQLGPLAAGRRAVGRPHRATGDVGRHPPGRPGPPRRRRRGRGGRASTWPAPLPPGSTSVGPLPPLVVTVCDQAHEEIDAAGGWLHWSVPDPVPTGTPAAFDGAVSELRARIGVLAELAVAS